MVVGWFKKLKTSLSKSSDKISGGIKKILKSKKIDESIIKDVIKKLKISDEDKEILLKLSPSSYTGLADKLTDLL